MSDTQAARIGMTLLKSMMRMGKDALGQCNSKDIPEDKNIEEMLLAAYEAGVEHGKMLQKRINEDGE